MCSIWSTYLNEKIGNACILPLLDRCVAFDPQIPRYALHIYGGEIRGHYFVVGIQIYEFFKRNPSHQHSTYAAISSCISQVKGWLDKKRHKLNKDKTNALLVNLARRKPHQILSSSTICQSRNLIVFEILVSCLTHISLLRDKSALHAGRFFFQSRPDSPHQPKREQNATANLNTGTRRR